MELTVAGGSVTVVGASVVEARVVVACVLGASVVGCSVEGFVVVETGRVVGANVVPSSVVDVSTVESSFASADETADSAASPAWAATATDTTGLARVGAADVFVVDDADASWVSAAVTNGSTPGLLQAAKTIPADAANAGIRLVLTGVTVVQMLVLGHACLGNLDHHKTVTLSALGSLAPHSVTEAEAP